MVSMSFASHRDLHERNRRSWNAATRAHNSHKLNQAEFLRCGGSTLFPEEVELLGNLEGKSLLHLLCNSGQDTLSLARLGARVTGVDISDEAIDTARQLSLETGLPGTFHRADVYDFLRGAPEFPDRYDRIFLSYGALCWLRDLGTFTRGVRELLSPGGHLVIVEFHPVGCCLGEDWRVEIGAFGGIRLETPEGVGDYVAESGKALSPSGTREGLRGFSNPHPSFEFTWGLGEIVTAILESGLTLRSLMEYPYANGWKILPDMQESPDRRMLPPEDRPRFPFMYSLTAERQS